ncbi:MAG: thioredoxin family protein [Candidatus Absconditabacterales bacterium]
MIIKIIGVSSPKHTLLQKAIKKAVKETKLVCEIINIDTPKDIAAYNVITLPGLVIDNYLISTEKIPSVQEIVEVLEFIESKGEAHCDGGGCENDGGCCGNCG